MAWTAPRTWVAGELVTADEMNEQLRDNTKALGKIGTLRHELRAPTAVETLVDGAWLELNEVDVSRATYPDLWTLLGTTLARTYTGATTLNAAITTTTATAVSITAWQSGWPVGGRKFLIIIDAEKMLVTGGFGTTTLTVVRGVESTAAATHLNAAAVSTPSQSPFGHGDGSTKFTLPGTGGRQLIAAASGGHPDVAALGNSEDVALASRRPKHKHPVAITDPGHIHQTLTHPGTANFITRGSGGGTDPANGSGNQWNMTGDPTTAAATTGITATAGPQTGAEPTDSGAYLVAGVWLVKAL